MEIKDLHANPKNPRTISDSKLTMLGKALEEFGDLGGFVFNRETKRLVGGHQRAKVFRSNAKVQIEKEYKQPTRTGTVAEGFVEFEGERFKYREVAWDEPKEKAANIAANKGAGEWDLPELGNWMRDLEGFEGFDLDLTMFDEDERSKFFVKKVEEGLTDPDSVPEAPKEPVTKPGDLYRLGAHRLLCGDSTQLADVQKLMGEDAANMVWTDPPYNVAYEGKTKDALKIKNDSMSAESFYQFLYEVYVNMLTVTKPGGAIYVAHADSEGMNFRKAMTDGGWLLKQCLIWVKQTLVMGRQDYHWKHEPILYGWAPGASHNWYTDRKQTTVLNFDRPSRSTDHPTMKPVELVEYCINNSCKPGGLVLDLFGGSGTTMMACERTGRSSALIELDPKYCDVILKRWEEYTGKKATLCGSEKDSVK